MPCLGAGAPKIAPPARPGASTSGCGGARGSDRSGPSLPMAPPRSQRTWGQEGRGRRLCPLHPQCQAGLRPHVQRLAGGLQVNPGQVESQCDCLGACARLWGRTSSSAPRGGRPGAGVRPGVPGVHVSPCSREASDVPSRGGRCSLPHSYRRETRRPPGRRSQPHTCRLPSVWPQKAVTPLQDPLQSPLPLGPPRCEASGGGRRRDRSAAFVSNRLDSKHRPADAATAGLMSRAATPRPGRALVAEAGEAS